jgi:hypothetical protein
MKRIWVGIGLLCGLAVWAAAPAAAQELPAQVLALYPQQVGELVFVDLQSARRSPHYARLKAQVLPERFRELETWAQRLGVDFDRNVDQISWAFVSSGDAANSDFVGIAEGAFYLDEIRKVVANSEIGVSDYNGATVYSLGENEAGREFLFAFPDNARLVFGIRRQVLAMLDRIRQGGLSLLDNAELRGLVDQVNRRASIWLVLDGEFTELGVRQFLGQATEIPGTEALAQRVEDATLRIQLNRGLQTNMSARCASTTDAVWFGAFLQSALYFQRQRLNESNPALANILADAQLNRAGDQLTLSLDIDESDMPALLQARSFTLSF